MYTKDIYQNMIVIDYIENDRYGLYWADEDGNNQAYIATCYGYENAVRVGRGIAHGQVGSVKFPPFMSAYESEKMAEN